MKAVYITFLVYFILFEPVVGYLLFQRYRRRLSNDPGEKLRYYKLTLVCCWIPALAIFALLAGGWLRPADIGILFIGWNPAVLGKWPSYGILLLFCVIFLLYLYQTIMAKISEPLRQRLASVKVPDEVACMLPGTDAERKYWFFISTSAGLLEELIYRGFLIYLISSLFAGLSIYLCILLAALLFGMGHTYQGAVGVLKTGVVGLLFALVYLCTGSLLPGILLHFLMDYAARDIGSGRAGQIPEVRG